MGPQGVAKVLTHTHTHTHVHKAVCTCIVGKRKQKTLKAIIAESAMRYRLVLEYQLCLHATV
jgi:hypothetical protein